ncbi:MAG: hypothetical protein IPP49_18465 [Saprospiraceae bacterium]|nr:hypothetical protein [Saprospiraceae bacterium]
MMKRFLTISIYACVCAMIVFTQSSCADSEHAIVGVEVIIPSHFTIPVDRVVLVEIIKMMKLSAGLSARINYWI